MTTDPRTRILCVKIASRGDLILAAPAFGRLRQSLPGAELDLLVGASCVDVAQHLPYFDRVRVIDDTRLLAGNLVQRVAGALQMWRIMRHSEDNRTGVVPYDQVIVFHRDPRYAVIAWASGVPIRRGFHGRFLTHRHTPRIDEHHGDQYIAVAGVQDVGGDGRWTFSETGPELAPARAAGFVGNGGRWIGLGFGGGRNVGSSTQLKSWPVASYVELAHELEREGHRVVWLGDETDRASLPTNAPGLNLAGKLTVPQTAAVISQCAAVVANDTMNLHLADSLGVPAIGIFGPTQPEHYRPRGARSMYLWGGRDLECSPCHRDGLFPPCRFNHQCMNNTPASEVAAAVRGALR
jgi:ADP-heptose:LPS heptosyltransferase